MTEFQGVLGLSQIKHIDEWVWRRNEIANLYRENLRNQITEHVLKNYSFEHYETEWDKILSEVYEKHGSWKNRKNYKSWRSEEL